MRIRRRIPEDDPDRAGAGSSAVFAILSSLLTIIVGLENTDYLESLLSLI